MKNPEDKIYEQWGVTPPSREAHATEDDIETTLKLQAQIKHKWKQQGAVLYCESCPFRHATEPRFVDYILTGTDEKGLPILKKLGIPKS